MNCFAELIETAKTINKLRREVLWMGCDKADPLDTVYVVYRRRSSGNEIVILSLL